MAVSARVAWSLRLLAVAVVTGALSVGVYLLVQAGGDGPAQADVAPTETHTPIPPTETLPPPTPTATEAIGTPPEPTAPPPTPTAPVPTPDTRVAIRDLPTLNQIQLGQDGKYFIADRGDGCRWVERVRQSYEGTGLGISLFTDCPADFFFEFRPETGEVFLAQE